MKDKMLEFPINLKIPGNFGGISKYVVKNSSLSVSGKKSEPKIAKMKQNEER